MSIYTSALELGPKNYNGHGLLEPNSIMVVYMDPLGWSGLGILTPKPETLNRRCMCRQPLDAG